MYLASVDAFSQKSNLQFDLVVANFGLSYRNSILNAKVLCNVTKPQSMKTDLMLRQYIVEFWTNKILLWEMRNFSRYKT